MVSYLLQLVQRDDGKSCCRGVCRGRLIQFLGVQRCCGLSRAWNVLHCGAVNRRLVQAELDALGKA